MTLARYLMRLLGMRALVALLGLTALLQVLDLLDNSGTLFAAGEGAVGMVTYTVWRLPMVAEQVLPIAVLAGTLITFFALVRTSELVAARAAGVTSYRLLASALPVALAAALLHFLLIDRITPWAEHGFSNWWKTVEARAKTTADDENDAAETTWMRLDGTLVSVGAVSPDRAVMWRLVFIRLDERGLVRRRLEARAAVRDGETWKLHGVRDLRIAQGETVDVATAAMFPWPEQIAPSAVVAAATPVESLSIARLVDILRGAAPAADSRARYRTMLHHNLALPLAAPLMVLLAMPAAFGSPRHGGAGRGFLIGFGLGMGYLTTDGVLTAMGEVGVLPPVLAAWTAPGLFTCLGGWILLRLEEP